jgi:hypothetical protein
MVSLQGESIRVVNAAYVLQQSPNAVKADDVSRMGTFRGVTKPMDSFLRGGKAFAVESFTMSEKIHFPNREMISTNTENDRGSHAAAAVEPQPALSCCHFFLDTSDLWC